MKHTTFPEGFLWGASTSAHQVEGGTHNQWSNWEAANAERMAAAAQDFLAPSGKYGEGVDWETIKAKASDPANYISGAGIDHYHRYKEDFKLLKSLNMNAFRFGIEWSRLQPKEGEWDEKEITHYHAYIAELHRLGIEPVLTLWHWTMPVWFTDKGAFEKQENLQYFYDYIQKIGDEFGQEVRYILTLNEPNVYTSISYIQGMWPPQQRSLRLGIKVYRNLREVHRQSYRILKDSNPDLQVGLAMNLCESVPLSPANPVNRLGVRLRDYLWNWWYLNAVQECQDFVGVNFYNFSYVDWKFQEKNPHEPRNDLGWYLNPGALHAVLTKTWQRYKLPILITENGLADAGDVHREWFIREAIGAVEKAIDEGVDVKGYLHWSLLDNFEWAYGWWPEFGLIHVDRVTLQRTIRRSAKSFASQIQRRKG